MRYSFNIGPTPKGDVAAALSDVAGDADGEHVGAIRRAAQELAEKLGPGDGLVSVAAEGDADTRTITLTVTAEA